MQSDSLHLKTSSLMKQKSPNFFHTGNPKLEEVTAQVCVQGRKEVQQNLIQIVTVHLSLHLNAHKMAHRTFTSSLKISIFL